MAIRAAWLHYVGKHTQADVAKKLGVSGVKVHRLIARAAQEGAVRFVIDGPISECLESESLLSQRYSLAYCEVVPRVTDDSIPLTELGVAGAAFLQREMQNADNKLIGLGHGRTLSASVQQLPSITSTDVEFVSLLGGLNRNFAANPHDVMHNLAYKTGATAYVMPVPFVANQIEDREVLLSQRGVQEVLRLAISSSLKYVGIGTAEPNAQIVSSGMIKSEEIKEIKAMGAVGELLGHFFNQHGEFLETSLTARTLSIALSDMRKSRIVAVAGGDNKVRAIDSIMKSNLISGLITDERTASALLRL
ncbi:MAG: DNA-binding transcriptional regulator LsrR (DeoR family) [Pseudomonadales bacterium]|jgi:DNA-binding transcriptional regulator LsrR (DeoR family)